MKRQLRQIYDDLAKGRLSREEALEKIKAIKLRERGNDSRLLLAVPVWERADIGVRPVESTDREVFLCELPSIDTGALTGGCTQLQASQSKTIAERYGEYALICFERIQAILQSRPPGRVVVQIVIAGDAEKVLFAGLSGLLKTATLENPHFAGQIILVPSGVSSAELERLLQEEKDRGTDSMVRYDGGARQVLRWHEVPSGAADVPLACKDGGVYLITGGLGHLGVLFAREILAQTRDARVVLTGRSTPAREKQALLDELESSGRVRYRQVHLGDSEQVARLIAGITGDEGRLDGVLHAAGMIADKFIVKKTSGQFLEILEPKVTGAFHLDQATRDVALDFFVLFSSVAGAMGNVGQADYAAANAFMDQFAAWRNREMAAGRRHGRTRSINWPLWQAGGMGLDEASRDWLRQTTGILPMQTSTGMDAFHRILSWPHDQVLVVEGDLARMRLALAAGGPVAAEGSPAVPAPAVTAINADELLEKTEEYLRRECAQLLKLPLHEVDPRAALEHYGIDSILAMRLTNQLEKTFGTLAKTLFFEYQTIRDLARYFVQSHAAKLAALFPSEANADRDAAIAAVPAEPLAPVPSRRSSRRRGSRREDEAPAEAKPGERIAIIGLSGRYPEAVDVEAYWRNLRDGKDCIIEVPRDRWDWRRYYSDDRTRNGHHYSKWGGFISGVDEFDPLFFNISPKEARFIDPQERLFLQHAWMAVEDAGYTRASLQMPSAGDLPGQVGVYAGVMYTEYQLFGAEAHARGRHVGVASSGASIANRVSYALNLHGPSVTMDTMCSSSLTAIHFACQDLKLGRTNLAIAGGVNVSIHPNKYLILSAGQFISSDGHCQSFGEGGDGYIPGEGVGVVVLKRLSDAERDGDHIYGVIRGSVLNHGGKTNGYTVPNPQAQASAIAHALTESQTNPREISYVEAHGTGTKLGDPIEIAALSKAFARHTQDTGFCLIGSAKSNIGHCESAAGIAGLTKVLLQMRHRQIVPSLHSAVLNPHIDFAGTPFVVNQELRAWEQPVVDGRALPRIAGLSSFGAGGSNAHMIIEEYPVSAARPAVAGPQAIVLSARTPEQLRDKTRQLLDFVRAATAIDLASMAYTLQAGREPMDERLGIIVSSAEQLLEKLQAVADGRQDVEDVFAGQVKRNKEALSVFSTDADLQQTLEKWIANRKLAKLLDLWVRGLEVDWTRLHGDAQPRRMSLPAYPFARERYWVDIAMDEPIAANPAPPAVLHPLLHSNTSDLRQQSYSSTFTGDEPFLHEKTLPAASCLEMAQIAVQKATHSEGLPELHDVTFAEPVVIDGKRVVTIALLPNGPDLIEFEIYSTDGETEIIHCQGRAFTGDRPIEPPVTTFAAEPRKKPAAIALTAPAAVVSRARSVGRAPIALSQAVAVPVTAACRVDDDANGVFTLRIPERSTGVVETLHRVRQESSLKVLLVAGLERWNGGEDLNQALVTFPYPVIALLQSDTNGSGFLAASLCDLMVCSEDAVYTAAPSDRILLGERFGVDMAQELLSVNAATGGDLRAKGWSCPVVPAAGVEAHARKLAASLAAKPGDALRLLKQHLARRFVDLLAGRAPAVAVEPIAMTLQREMRARPHEGVEEPQQTATVALQSRVVTATEHAGGVVVVKMEDRDAKNMFSDALIEGVMEAFAHIARTPQSKVVVLTGFDSYFASGGTKETLLDIQQGKRKFTDTRIFQAPLDCELPVIAAMQGHGIGAGWCLGMLADVVLLSEESQYVSPYMNYGFTPGAGATYILPATLGHDLARESLFTGQPATGRELKARGVALPVLPRAEVYPAAMALAKQLAQSPRERLLELKRQRISQVRGDLEETYRLELAMHDQTFVGRADTLARIETGWSAGATPPVPGTPRDSEDAPRPIDSDALSGVTATLRSLLAAELLMRETDVDENAQFVDLGLDSISGVSWIRKINEKYQTSIEATRIYSYPTLAQLSRFVRDEAEQHGKLPVSVPVPVAPPAIVEKPAAVEKPVILRSAPPAPRTITPLRTADTLTSWRKRTSSRFTESALAARAPEPIAVIGMAGQFPQARNVDEFWRNIAEGRNCIVQIPEDRWDLQTYYQPGDPVPGKANSRWVGALEGYAQFDPLFFNISPTEAESMDPQQRLFLQACWHGIEHAGYAARSLSGSKCGVFVGCATTGEYHQSSRELQWSAQGFTGSAMSILAARISYLLNLQGPCISIDTACSSSLVAIAQACDSLVSGDSDLALAGGVYVMTGPEMHIRTSQAGMLSAQGKCFTFDRRADGFVPGEGAGVIVLKRLADAQRDQDVIYGVIEGWGVNQDGKTNGITAPNPESQARLEQAVYDKYRIDPANIQLIEAHGTGTKLGDPIEVEGLKQAFRRYTQNVNYCALGAVKSNIGHTLTAAGVAGMIKLLQALQHKQLPPTIHFEQLNEHIDLTNSPFFVNTRLQEWTLNGAPKRQAAISSFGFGGTNAHVVVGEFTPAVSPAPVFTAPRDAQFIVPLSARTRAQLQEKAGDLLDFIRDSEPDLASIAYTLQTAREPMEERMGVVVSSTAQLATSLRAWLRGDIAIDGLHEGQSRRGSDALGVLGQDDEVRQALVDRWIAQKKLAKLLDLWVRGVELDWNRLYGDVRPRRIALPLYPFARERYWIDATAERRTASPAAVLHPLLHANTSDFTQQSYASTFAGDEFYLTDHQVRSAGGTVEKMLPGMAYLEMARAAVDYALREHAEGTVLELRDVVWTRPVVVGGDDTRVNIALSPGDGGRVDYAIFSADDVVHCEGRAIVSAHAPAALDLGRLEGMMTRGTLEPNAVYEVCARMGLLYGPAFRAVTAILRGEGQVLARLRLPKSIESTAKDYVLHPSLMDSAVQAAVGLLDDTVDAPRIPFALDSLRVLAPCGAEMAAWVRVQPGSNAAGDIVRLDVDLCDAQGSVCVQMSGLSLRALSRETGNLLAIPVWQSIDTTASRNEYSECHVVRLEVDSHKTIADNYTDSAIACFEKIQTILRSRPSGKVLVQVLATDEILLGLAGLLKTASLENPQFAGQIILGREQDLAAERDRAFEPVVRYEQGSRQVLRWREVDAGESPIAFKEHGVYLITGGSGALGRIFARDILARTQTARVILASRSGVKPQLDFTSDRVSHRQLDLGDLEQVRRVVAEIRNEVGPLTGILHCAGMIADNFILKKSASEFRDVLAPKVTGTYNLDEATRDVALDFFVLFSSVAGAMGNLGQADYAAANGFMDQFATHRNRRVAAKQRHGRTRSINWPLWREGGLKIDTTSRELLEQATGMRPMQTATGLEALHHSLALPYDQLFAAEGELPQMRRALLAGPVAASEPRAEQPAVAGESLAAKTEDYLRREFSGLLKLPAQSIDPQAQLEKYGIDSILAMKLTGQLEKTFGSLSKTLFFEYQTVRDLAGYFVKTHSARLATIFASPASTGVARREEPQPQRATPVAGARRFRLAKNAAPALSADPIAIIGLSGRYPEAVDVEAYWMNLREGKDCITEVPKSRWDWREYFTEDRTTEGHHYSRWGGFIEGVDEFDPLFFNISPKEAKLIDPQERLFLQHAWMAVEDAGYTRASLQIPSEGDLPGQAGVYVGLMYTEYQMFGAEAAARGKRLGVAGSAASIANRVSFALNLHGPSMTVDTMCSSSLTAIHLACQDLKQGRIGLAIAGGVNVSIHPNKYLMLSAGQFISSDGHCQSFGEGGDGYIPGEGVGVVVLKRLSDAERDGDHIYGVIRGSALNHGGRTNGYTVPNPQAQSSAISRALTESHTDARHISYIEAHGTGTKLGDPIEIAALNKAFQHYTQDTGFCRIGSAKSNIGHCESAAGIAGLTKVLLQMQHRQIVPSLHSARLNPHIDFAGSPFVVNQELLPWEPPVIDGRALPRIAGISSFGAGGSNAHLIVEEYPAPVRDPIAVAPVVIVLSARTAPQLKRKAQDLLRFVEARIQTLDLAATAYTLQVGREAMDERLGLIVSSAPQLADKLRAYVAGESNIEDAYQGQARRNTDALSVFSSDADLQQAIDKWIASGKLSKLLDLWVKGLEVEWRRLYGGTEPQRVSLPVYPFARERHWVDLTATGVSASTAVLHPLLHSNASVLSEQRYRSTFKGDEHFIVRDVLLEAACLEMARAAVEHAVPERPRETVLELRDVIWLQPVLVRKDEAVNIALFAAGDDAIDFEIYSGHGESEIVHCQGGARWVHASAPAAIDEGTAVRLTTGAGANDYVLHPVLLNEALGGRRLSAIESLRIFSPCTAEMFARTSGGDLDLCDAQGRVCVQMRGMTWAAHAVARPKQVAAERKKPAGISLMAPGAVIEARQGSGAKPSITLSPARSEVRLSDRGEGIFAIQVDRSENVVAAMRHALAMARENASLKALIIEGAERLDAHDDAIDQKLYQALIEFPFPVVAVLENDAIGAGFLLGALCDFMVCNEDARYGYTVVTPAESVLLRERFGAERAQGLVTSTGKELRADGWTCPIVASTNVDTTVREMAAALANKSQEALRLLKQHLTRGLIEPVRALEQQGRHGGEVPIPQVAGDAWLTQLAPQAGEASEEPAGIAVPIELQSSVVTATAHPGGIVVVTLADHDAKNMFSPALMDGVTEVFAHIERTPAYKVVILTGYDQYFASGGTRESLLAIQAGEVKFTDAKIFQLPLDCRLPVIAAMQGHGIGAGWCLGMFADGILLSEESRYVSPYMDYGFTPGAGATLILPERLGADLARESLLMARPFTGRELKDRGLRHTILPRNQVLATAMTLARRIARETRDRLIELKQQASAHVRERLEETYRLELAMHDATFVGRSDTLAQIQSRFQAQTTTAPTPTTAAVVHGDGVSDVAATLRALLAGELQMQESDIDDRTQFVDLGLDSISGVSWIRKINDKYRTSIEATKVYAHPTLAELSQYVRAEAEASGALRVARGEEREPAREEPHVARDTQPAIQLVPTAERHQPRRTRRASRRDGEAANPRRSQSIAIIGMAGQFPQARNTDEFWRNLAEGRNCITQVSPDRWDAGTYYQAGEPVAGKSNCRWLGALDDYDRFDPLFFNISPTEAESMDPQQRLFLQACWQSIEDAGHDARALSGSKCGVFVGCAMGDYHQLSRTHQLTAQGFTGAATSILAARISYFLNLQGPCVSIDTACSSSLVAIAQACDSLRSGGSDLALAGGVYVMAGPEMHIRTSQAGMLSPDGRCFSFDQRANGFVPGEGVGVIVLKRLEEAERDGDIVYGVIEGWGVNQDGKTNGITAPNPDSQVRLEQDVYEKYGIDPANIQLIEAHGTATKLGDPIEVEALKTAFRKYTQKETYCALGSVKSNIGHTLTAAGIAGTIKVLLALKYKQLPPTINFEQLNEHIDLAGSPFFVNDRLQAWDLRGARRRLAAVSSFGFGGTNAHLVIGEHQAPAVASAHANGKVIVPLSARTAEQLRAKAGDLLQFVRREPASLAGIAYTLQTGRVPMDERVAFVVSSVGQLAGMLEAFVDERKGIEGVYEGQAKRSRDNALSLFAEDADLRQTIEKWIVDGKVSRLADLWARGLDLDWNKVYGEQRPRRISLPVYPFARERYWIDVPPPEQQTSTAEAEDSIETDTLLAVPAWQASALELAVAADDAEHHVITCELPPVDGAVSLHDTDGKSIAQRFSDYAIACFGHIQTILGRKPQQRVLMQIVVPDRDEWRLLAGLSGLLETAALENPRFTGQLILVSPEIAADELRAILQAEKERGLDSRIHYEGGERKVLRWHEVDEAPAATTMAFREHGVYLITGGMGGLGLLFANDILAKARKAKVVLTGRSPLTNEKRALLSDRMLYRQLDLGDAEQVRRAIDEIRQEHGRLNGIVHSAGMIDDNVIAKKTSAEFMRVLSPKVTGTYNLDQATRDVELDFFVLFSSIAGVMGNPGQADYATASCFLDQFAAYRNREVAAKRRHGITRSIDWSLWESGGMRVDAAGRELVRQMTGIQPIPTATGLEAFHRSLALPCDQILVVEGEQPKLTESLQNARIFAPSERTAIVATQAPAMSTEELQQQIRALLGGVLGMEPSRIDADQPFNEIGLDSFLGAELVVSINRKFGTELSHIKLFDYSTVHNLSALLEQELRKRPAPVPLTAPVPKKRARVSRKSAIQPVPAGERVAVIGMSGRYPQANDLHRFWQNLAAGRNSIVEVPRDRWDVDRYYDPDRAKTGKTASKWLGALDDIDCFDPLFFRISPQEAEYMDPQHRLFLQESYRAFEDAGYSTTALSNRKCGVYLGISTNEYMTLLSRAGIMSAPVTSNSYAIAAARIAYYLNLKGPAISVDTACSSSLVAVHLACQAILNGEIDMALAGGVTLWLTPESYLAMSQAGMFSPSGQCKTFDESADGIVNGEGVGAVVLKRLSDAQRDGDFIYGIILGSGINQDGKTNGITAPSVQSQIELERGVYAKFAIDPDTISYVETHGTGTKLGDPIELEALSTVFSEKTSRRNYCALGALKSNIGHTTSAAGVAGLQKVLLSMRHRTLVPTLNVTKENSRFDFASSPFYISRETKAWNVPADSLRRAAVSSFGFSGTNAHLVVEEYPAPAAQSTPAPSALIIPLSARTAEQLHHRALDLLAFLRNADEDVDVGAVAYTLQTGRDAMEERVGLIVDSAAQLIDKLSAYVNGERAIDGAYYGRVEPGGDGIPVIGRGETPAELLALWARGQGVDWNRLYGGVKPRRISLPTYPFAKQRCWITAAPDRGQDEDIASAADIRSIEEIMNQIDDDGIDTEQAVKALKLLV